MAQRRSRRTKKNTVTLKPSELRGLLSLVEGDNTAIICKMLSIEVYHEIIKESLQVLNIQDFVHCVSFSKNTGTED